MEDRYVGREVGRETFRYIVYRNRLGFDGGSPTYLTTDVPDPGLRLTTHLGRVLL